MRGMIEKQLTRRGFLKLSSAALAVGAATWSVPAEARPVIMEVPTRKLFLHNTHNNEIISVTYWRKGKYDKAALKKLNHIMRDNHNGLSMDMDKHLFDLLYKVQAHLKNHDKVELISGYRSPQTNAMLATYTSGVAKKSYHMHGMAIDLRIPGVPTRYIQNCARSLQGLGAGGVGYYPESDFVHIDTGPVRTWQQEV
jgi:uncharacterized protein YcbK (DUF882 family)